MATELRYPSFNARTESEQALKGYLHQLVDQLQFALNNVSTPSTTVVQIASRTAPSAGSATPDATATFNATKSLIIKSADIKGDEIPLDTTMPLPRDQIKGEWNPDNLECGIHVVANNNALKTSDGTVIMYNGVLIQMPGTVDGSVKLQLALPVDENRNPMYRLCWYSNWSTWRSMKL